MSRRTHSNAERQMRGFRAPGESQAGRRAWRVVRTAYADRGAASRRRLRARFALAPAVMAIGAVLALTPAGATVRRWIDQTLGVKHARVALFSLPARGQILVAGPGGAWTVSADGSKRRLGSWRQATWSPHALYVAVAARDQLTAVNLRGTPQWSIARPAVSSPRWFAPNGFRLAYLSGTTLRVIAGDGTGDRELANQVGLVAPAWWPGHRYLLAYVQNDGTIVLRNADTGRIAWSHPIAGSPLSLAWSADGARLLVVTRSAAVVLDRHGHQVARLAADGSPVLAGALSPSGQQLAMLSDADVTMTDLSRPAATRRRVFTGVGLRQLEFSPDGHWLLVTWPAADQWVFIHLAGSPRILAVSRIAEQFSTFRGRRAFPAAEGWCCTAAGEPG